jgi:hypothetical protein
MESTIHKTIGEQFFFKNTKSSFIINPKEDLAFYAPRTGIDLPKLLEGIQVNLVTDQPPKRFFWGIYGGGKTHTLYHLAWLLENELKLDIIPIYIECPSVPKKSTFLDLYYDGIMASLGQDFIIKLFTELIDSIGTVRYDELLKELKNILEDEDLARAVSGLLGARQDKELIFWRYLSGGNISETSLKDLGISQSLSNTIPSRLANILIIIGKLVKKLRKKMLVLIIDEIDRLQALSDDYGISTYEEAFRRLLDDNQIDLSIIVASTARNIRDLPEPFSGGEGGAVLSRIGASNIIQISEILPPEIDNFIKSIINYIVDEEKVKVAFEEIKKDTTEDAIIDIFPFTKEAIEALKGKLRDTMTPREITQRMTDVAGKAFLQKKRIITSNVFN